MNLQAITDKEDVTFDPKITLQRFEDGYRVFCDKRSDSPAHQLDPIEGEDEPSDEIVFIGSHNEVNEDGENCSAGGIWYGPEVTRNTTVRVSKNLASKEGGIAAAILYVIQNSPREVSLHFRIQSKQIIHVLTKGLEECEDKGWLGVADSVLLKAITAALRGRGTRCTLREAGDLDRIGMSNAVELAKIGLDHGEPAPLYTDIPQDYNLDGIKLSSGTQSIFYQAIKAMRTKPDRMKTTIMLDITQHAARDLSGRTPTDGDIWRSVRNKDISRTTRDFMWRCLHQAYKVGPYWSDIPTFEHWGTCRHCQVEESMEHILLECDAPGQEVLWKLAQRLWELKGFQWPVMNYGRIFAGGLVDVQNGAGKSDKGANRLFRILISETAHLIWKLRCTRVIERNSNPARYYSEAEIHNKWLHCINSHLKTNALLTDTKKYGNRAIKIKTDLNTWKGVLKDPENLPEIWVWQSGFVVGIPPLRPLGRNQ
ncbi:ribonuclease H-like protein [Mycena alexandri]|uniref:Ribonuclease H-like protein n=1 Tax=Mycena alexandri TaxID=1745969 RepID=A0AAD6WMS6_9AGAR|nr:ribonuclease H-like protein [Mycena alexandri]